jgi:peptidyl-prolyl cis-trans isomerase C
MKKLYFFAAIGLLLVFTLTAAGQEVQVDPAMNPKVLSVNGEVVYAAEISLVMQNIMNRGGGQSGQEPNQQVLQVATQRIIEQKLLAQEARRFGLRVDEKLIQNRIDVAARQVGSREALARVLAPGGATIDLLEEFYRELELGHVFISRQLRPTVTVTDEEVQEFIDANPEIAIVVEQIRARHILITVPESADLETDNLALARAEKARERAIAGEDFIELVKELSDGPAARTGGDLGFFGRERVLPNFAEAAFALEVGGISQVVRTKYGYHVIKVEEHRAGGTMDGEQLQQRARDALTNQKTADLVGELLRTLYDKAEIEDFEEG